MSQLDELPFLACHCRIDPLDSSAELGPVSPNVANLGSS
jgi:hypothetical protein